MYVSVPGLTPQQVKSATSCERPLAHPSGFIVHLWCVTVCIREFLCPGVWLAEAPLCPSPPGSRHLCPVPASISDPAVKHVHIYRLGAGDMEGHCVFRQSWRPAWAYADMLICVSGKPRRKVKVAAVARLLVNIRTCAGGTWLCL